MSRLEPMAWSLPRAAAEVIARVRGMVQDVAHQLLFATADEAGLRDREALVEELGGGTKATVRFELPDSDQVVK